MPASGRLRRSPVAIGSDPNKGMGCRRARRKGLGKLGPSDHRTGLLVLASWFIRSTPMDRVRLGEAFPRLVWPLAR
jgi:hypothetical protein